MRRPLITRRQLLHATGAWRMGAAAWLSSPANAAVFMDIEQAQKMILPEANQLTIIDLALDASTLTAIANVTETRVPKNFAPRVWQATAGGRLVGWVAVDRAIGKFDWIDFAVGFGLDKAVMGVEILAYRESHGAEIRQAAWRKQFLGRKGPKSMRFADDIRNISGATLSCQHVTEGVQRLSALIGQLGAAR